MYCGSCTTHARSMVALNIVGYRIEISIHHMCDVEGVLPSILWRPRVCVYFMQILNDGFNTTRYEVLNIETSSICFIFCFPVPYQTQVVTLTGAAAQPSSTLATSHSPAVSVWSLYR